MIKINLPSLALYLLLIFGAINAFGQVHPTRHLQTGERRIKLDKNKVPQIVTETFNKDYPIEKSVDWYGYPSFDDGADWYEYDPSYYSNKNPENYVVEFSHNDTLDKIVYNKSGRKVAIHRNMNAALPEKVSDALQNSKYKTWQIAKDQEEIFKDNKVDQIKVYKVMVQKGHERHTLYFQQNGKLLRMRKNIMK